jgi:PAS domain S-box-containing protein
MMEDFEVPAMAGWNIPHGRKRPPYRSGLTMKEKKIFIPKSELPQLLAVVTVMWVLGLAVSLGWNIFRLSHIVLAHTCLLLVGLCAIGFTWHRVRRSEAIRGKAEDVLREKEAAFSVITTTASEAIVMINHEGNITYWNNAAEILFGYSDKEAIGKEMHHLIIPEIDHEIFKDGFSEFIRTGTGPVVGNTLELVAVNREGREFPVEVSVSTVRIKGDFHAAGIIRDITFRKKAEEALRESERRYRELADLLPQTVFEMDLDGKITFGNKNAFEMFYKEREDLARGLDGLDMLAPEDRERAKKNILNMFENPEFPTSYEYTGLRGDGSRFPTIIYSNCITSKNTVQGLRGIIVDISERARAEEALRESEELFRTLVQSAPDAIFIQTQGRFAYVNEAALKLFGASSEAELLGHSILDLVHPDFRAAVQERIKSTNEDRTAVSAFEQKYLKLDGTPVHAETHGVPISYGKEDGALIFVRDITERKKAEEDLLRLHRWNQLILNAAGEGIVGLDLDGRVIFANPTAAEIIGQKPDELIGDTIYHMVQHPRRETPSSGINRSSREIPDDRSSYHISDEVFKRKDGTTVPVSFTNTPIVEGGQVKGTVITIRDLTESKKIEEAKTKLEAQLYQALKMEAIGTLAGGIAHDFNNILAVIIGYSEIMLTDIAENSPTHRHLSEVLKAALRARDLVRQILVFSRMKTGVNFQSTRLGPVVSESLKFLRATLPATIEIRQNIEDQDGMALVDATQIHQLIVNLCTNAFQAMEETGGVLEVSLAGINFENAAVTRHSKIEPGPYLKLTVTDSGHGMDAATLERIFDPYFTTRGPGRGSGLGLAVVHGIVERHNAVIEVQSEPKKGSSFQVYFPKIQGPAAEQEDRIDASLPRGNERILLVDDEEALADVGRKTLEWLGYDVTEISTSAEALALFRENPDLFDLVITDYTMPKMTGAELAMELIRIRPGTPIILCTGYTERLSRERAKEIGINEFLMKPMNRRELAWAVRRVLDERK